MFLCSTNTLAGGFRLFISLAPRHSGFMNYDNLQENAGARGLVLLGGFHPNAQDKCPPGTGTLVLMGPDPVGFWPTLQAAPEAREPDAVDRWSRRVIGTWACDLKAKAVFPFGEPRHPFISWALRSARCHLSPATLLVHDTQGLMVSFRGALALRERIELPAPLPSPCESCIEKPCLVACPVGALGNGYDTEKCHSHLDTVNNTCMPRGCAARRACPVSSLRPDAQSAHHMRYFHR